MESSKGFFPAQLLIKLELGNEKRAPGCLGYDKQTTQLCKDYFINHHIKRILVFNKQDSMECHTLPKTKIAP